MHPSSDCQKQNVKRYIVSRMKTYSTLRNAAGMRLRRPAWRVLAVLANGSCVYPPGWAGVKFLYTCDARAAIKFIESGGGSYVDWQCKRYLDRKNGA